MSFDELSRYVSGHSTDEAHVPMLAMHLQERSPTLIANVVVHHVKQHMPECALLCIQIARDNVIDLADEFCNIIQ